MAALGVWLVARVLAAATLYRGPVSPGSAVGGVASLASPPAGEVLPPGDGWSPVAATWWAAVWALADVAALLVVAALVGHHLRGPFRPRRTRTARAHVAASVATVAVVAMTTASYSTIRTEVTARRGAKVKAVAR